MRIICMILQLLYSFLYIEQNVTKLIYVLHNYMHFCEYFMVSEIVWY